ncbi:uncharacterized protein LOC117788545 [Drosophila innubila]|uniref:uncharacterized protein LOC117788545 n=1 Tax=Drosophila innubila TaxID=198719 RepID=UPI00148DA414|nr:uncharacterized protein LOC117788545 [Drosophila innubila]
MVCYLLLDSPPDYDDDEEESLQVDNSAMNIHTKYATNLIDEEFRKARCIPNNLTDKEIKSYWKHVRRWQREVEKQFLSTNIFIVKEELDGGRAIKINLWNVFKIQMFVICNKTKESDDSSIESTTSLQNINTFEIKEDQWNCNANMEIGIWINDQIKVEKFMEAITNKFSNILAKIEMQINKNCCPYAILRDRIEVINDNIDTILQLRTLDQYERAESNGYAWLDVQNLLSNKLDYLEARLNSMTNQSKISLKRLLATIHKLEARLRTVKDQINKSYENAKKCSLNCDWGELPSIEELQARLKTLEANLKT